MDYVIHALGLPFNGATVNERSLGGSESAAYYLGRELARRGHRVTMFTADETGGTWDGVQYVFCGPLTQQTPLGAHFEFYARNTPHDVLIMQRHPSAFDRSFASKVNIWQMHDLALHRTGGPVGAMMWNVDAVTTVSEWHKRQVCEVFALPGEIISVVRNGVDPALYAGPIGNRFTDGLGALGVGTDYTKLRLLYQSRPERGLEHLVRPGGIMDRLRGVARLYVCGYDNTTEQMAPYYAQLQTWAKALPNVTLLGALTKPQLADLQRELDVLCYPTEFEEVSCCVGDTLVDMPRDYTKYPRGVPISELVGKSGFPVWSYDEEIGKFQLADVKWVAKTGVNREIWKVAWDDGTCLRATPDHKVLTYKRGWVELKDLIPGESVVALKKHAQVTVSVGEGAWPLEHRIVAEYAHGSIEKGWHVDHIDGNPLNNSPENLQVLSPSDHAKKTFRGLVKTPHAARAHVPGWRKKWDEDHEFRNGRIKHLRASGRKLWDRINTLPSEERDAWIAMRAAKKRENLARKGAAFNHKVVSVEFCGHEDVYDMEVERTHNFIAGGVVIHNCITAMEAMHAGLPMVTSAVAALPETCAGAGVELIPLKDGEADEDAFVTWLNAAALDRMAASEDVQVAARAVGGSSVFVSNAPTILDRMREAQRDAAKLRTWEHACDDLEALVDECFERSRSYPSLLKHALKVGDIPLFDYVATNVVPNGTADGALVKSLTKERREMYAFLESDEAYQAHYLKFGGQYHEETKREHRWRVPVETTRWKAVLMQLTKAKEKLGRPLRVLDYGCAHGHYTVGLAQQFPDCEFVGIDHLPTAIEEAREWSAQLGLKNVFFIGSSQIDVPTLDDAYDVILLAEVLEHVRDYRALLAQARAALKPDGALITTTPYGPWEWVGHEAFKVGREHWQHFERQDLLELFAGMSPEVICAPGGMAPGNTVLGSWVVLAWPAGAGGAFGHIDMARKLRATKPEQTISACMIVKDGEHVLGKALESLVPWVAEIVIGIDSATTDKTLDVITEFERRNPWTAMRVFHNVSALKEGFDTARNATVEQASGDWVLWMDSDEELVGGAELPKLQRTNMHQAYCIPQMHFSINPPQVLTVDLPSRMFRRNGKLKFYGRVHEHPEVAPGEAIPTATARGELAFAHNGYITEDKRRERYFRNLPLLLRDIEDHPDRLLNKFLLIRDLAQGVGFELQANGMQPLPDHRARCERVITLWRELLANEKPVSRMLLDSLQYYTMAAEVLGGWFEANVALHVAKAPADTKLNVQAKFVSIDDFTQLLQRLSKEATANYESRYF